MNKVGLIWFRNDLRIHDNAALSQANQECDLLIPLYCFDPRHYAKTHLFGFEKTGFFRAQFLIESIQDLNQSLQSLDSALILRNGNPENIIPALVKEFGVSQIYCHKEITHEEINVENALLKALNNDSKKNCHVQFFEGHTLYQASELPFSIQQIPQVFTQYRNAVEKHSKINAPIPFAGSNLKDLPQGLASEKIPSFQDLNIEEKQVDVRNQMNFAGGETAGLKRLKEYIWDKDLLKTYKQTRNGLLGMDYSSKFSPWLANGCLSPKMIYQEVQKYERERIKNDSTYWLIFELLWRDFFRFTAQKQGNQLFRSNGLQPQKKIKWKTDHDLFLSWSNGETGIPFIDANMKELNATGFMSNRGRQNVASYLTKHLGLDWRMGAEYFESLLIDYDVCSNYGNWAYIAGVGNDPIDRIFNPHKQADQYDSKGKYVEYWLGESIVEKQTSLFD
ncbi:MAG: DASH family cryptochrome [Candidatus Melainabacteria bacterium]|jgi:deoxyribodipyrimidine photo-lyase